MNPSTKSWLFATVSSLALATASAHAADAPVAPPVKAPAALPLVTWTGPYAGLSLGGAWHRVSHSINAFAFSSSASDREAGFILGAHVGYNWQSGNWVTGLEADINWLDADYSRSFVAGNTRVHSNIDWLATFRGRIGVTMSPTLVYLTGGLALAGLDNGWRTVGYAPDLIASRHKTKAGFVAGAGVEHQLGRNWTGRAEVLYVDLGRTRASTPGFIGGLTYTTEFKNRLVIGRAALSYRW
jgi:outer membrane immunogenic protein